MDKEQTFDSSRLFTIIDELIAYIQGPAGRAATRERSLAVTKLEEASMWLAADVVKGDKSNG